ncbi:sensor histidine kinase [Clostridium sp. 'White wine YQ']|uniref:sensor histidine kinase n=1 Tax=Clostridium sp. 'White wine YQ' TaxID=3027474 RepID=UPI0023663B3A|nr:GHKL domain-containing protein [Clostridium sp. 'White wine YQ']MDD7796076.1 GHKL domain-containing protein [Clostridium sp. 'White wine YQ']
MENFINIFISIVCIFISIMNLVTIKFTKKEVLIFTSVAILGSFPFGYISPYLSIIPMNLILIFCLYKKTHNIGVSIILPLAATIICVVATYILIFITMFVFKINIGKNFRETHIYYVLTVLIFPLIIVISSVIGMIINRKNVEQALKFKNRPLYLIATMLIFTLIIFYINLIIEDNSEATNRAAQINVILFLIYFGIIIAIMYVLLRGVTKDLEIKNKQTQMQNLQEYTANLERLYSEMRAFRHDYINIISSMIGHMDNNDMESLKRHFYDNIIPLSSGMENNNFKIGHLKNIEIPEVKGLLSSKLVRAQEIGIDVNIDIADKIDDIKINVEDATRALGILLDNAIEAAQECEKPKLDIGFVRVYETLLIVIKNNCVSVPKVFEINRKGFSTKGKNRGLGLSNLREIIDKYDNVFLETNTKDTEFIQKLTLS